MRAASKRVTAPVGIGNGKGKSSFSARGSFVSRPGAAKSRVRPAWLAKPAPSKGWTMRVLQSRLESVQKMLRQVLAELLTDSRNNAWSARQLLNVSVGTETTCVPGTPFTKSIGTHEKIVTKQCISVRLE